MDPSPHHYLSELWTANLLLYHPESVWSWKTRLLFISTQIRVGKVERFFTTRGGDLQTTHNFIKDYLLLWWCKNYINTDWNVLHSFYHTRNKHRNKHKAEDASLLGCDMVPLQVLMAALHPWRLAHSATPLWEPKISQTAELMHVRWLYSLQGCGTGDPLPQLWYVSNSKHKKMSASMFHYHKIM
jgi:hypothetical protein